MELEAFKTLLSKASRSFQGFGPLGIYAGIDEEFIPEAEVISASVIHEVVDAYLIYMQSEKFSESEHIWILENIAMHSEILEKFNAAHVKALCMHYLNSVQSHATSRIFCIMLLLILDKYLNDKQSFVMFIFNQAKDVNNERLTQRETLMDLTDVLIDLDALKHQEKALRILTVLSERSNLKYVTDRVIDLASVYGDEVIHIVRGWVGR